MTIEYSGLGATYHGFSGPQPAAPDRSARRKRLLLIGIGGALALGLALGLWAKPQMAPVYEPKPMAAVSQPASPDEGVQIVVNTPLPPPPLPTPGRLEVLPPDMAAAAPRAIRVAAAPTVAPPALAPAVERLRPVASVERAAPEPAAMDDDAPIDCRNPAGAEEADICRDIGFAGRGARERDVYDPRAAAMDEAWDRR